MQPGANQASGCLIKALMKIMNYIVAAMAAAACAVSCTASYDVDKSTELTRLAASDTTLTQANYSQMITMLDKGYSYMRSRLARAAFESNPTVAINDVINFMGDSTLMAVQKHSVVLIKTLEDANLDSENKRRFAKVVAKYNELEASLINDTTAVDTTFGRGSRGL